MQAYSDPRRETDPYALPDVEVFYIGEACNFDLRGSELASDGEPYQPGWYYWFCFPGCLPDSDPIGPFASEDEALADAQDQD